MELETADYQGRAIRYSIVRQNGILLNTEDVCAALDITERPAKSQLNRSCLNIAFAIEAALTKGKYEPEFVDWLETNFIGYDLQTAVQDDCDDQWSGEK